ncbi:MAG: hypothetical protein M1330_00005 [Armatimonadetes bacterium]|nr:hypothetical protein [Armatimonadota bacterium]
MFKKVSLLAITLFTLSGFTLAKAQVIQLNGQFITASFNPTGDLIAPEINGAKQTFPNATGLLFTPNPTSTNPADTKREMIAWPPPAENWSVKLDGIWNPDSIGGTTAFSNLINDPNGEHSVTFTTNFSGELQVVQTVSFNDSDPIHQVNFDLAFTNLTADTTLTGIEYLRSTFPHQGATFGDLGIPDLGTTNSLGSPFFTSSQPFIGVDSVNKVATGFDFYHRHLGLVSTFQGAMVNAYNSQTDGNNIDADAIAASNSYYVLTSTGPSLVSVGSTNPFNDSSAINLWFNVPTLSPGASFNTATFSYVLGGPSAPAPPPVPEPGNAAFGVSLLGTMTAFLISRRLTRRRIPLHI